MDGPDPDRAASEWRDIHAGRRAFVSWGENEAVSEKNNRLRRRGIRRRRTGAKYDPLAFRTENSFLAFGARAGPARPARPKKKRHHGPILVHVTM